MPLNDSFKGLFIDKETLTDNSTLDKSIDDGNLRPVVKNVSDIKLQQLIGTALYADLQKKIEEKNLNADEKFLIDAFLHPALIKWVEAEFILDSGARLKNGGAVKLQGDNFMVPDLQELQYQAGRKNNDAEFYASRALKHLRANNSKFPKFEDCTEDNKEDLKPAKTGYKFPIFIGKKFI